VTLELRRSRRRPLVIGHRGAGSDAPENTIASFEAAIAVGVDLVEFDVAPGLRVAHDPDRIGADAPTLDEVLALLATAAVGAHVDLKLPGYEAEAVAAVRRHGLEGAAVVSTAFASSARRVHDLAPGLPVAIGYPRDRHGVSRLAWPAALTRTGAAALRAAMPLRVPLLLRSSQASVLALHHMLCSPSAVAAAHRAGATVFGWTANEPETVLRLNAAGVDAIVSDDPRLVLEVLATLPPA
jgi:glycerophosphoryl diester phosphodiesterase